MRPNIDIPWSIHGRIREYAKDRDVSITEAYIEVLSEGLEAVETQADDAE